ncbi:hypothetical protein DFH08DRAFT_319349, partial [Mycena albidolilacea]
MFKEGHVSLPFAVLALFSSNNIFFLVRSRPETSRHHVTASLKPPHPVQRDICAIGMDSPFQKLLHTNHVPTDAECESIRDFLRGPRKDLRDLTEEIARLQALIDEASLRRSELQKFVDAHLALVSLVRRLPDETMQDIFLGTLSSTRNPALSSNEAPLLLCQICKSWWNLALSTPRLWASIHIVVPPVSKLPQLAETVTAWLGRSGAVPLNISLTYSGISTTTCDISSLVSPIVSISRRWQNIKLLLMQPHYWMPLSPDDVPMLQSISIDYGARRVSATRPETLNFFGTKSLRSIDFRGIQNIVDTRISWGFLTQFTIKELGICYDDAFCILSQCQLLESCVLMVRGRMPTDSSSNDSSHQHFSLSRLSSLSINHDYFVATEAARFFGNMALPALRLFCSESDPVDPHTPLRSLFPSGTNRLESLELCVRNLSSSILLAALADTPSLETLHLTWEPLDQQDPPRFDAQLLTHLTPVADTISPVLCPKLRHLNLKHFKAVSDDTLLEFILSRTRPQLADLQARTDPSLPNVVRLERFSCGLRRPMERDIQVELQPHNLDLKLWLRYQSVPTYSPLEM